MLFASFFIFSNCIFISRNCYLVLFHICLFFSSKVFLNYGFGSFSKNFKNTYRCFACSSFWNSGSANLHFVVGSLLCIFPFWLIIFTLTSFSVRSMCVARVVATFFSVPGGGPGVSPPRSPPSVGSHTMKILYEFGIQIHVRCEDCVFINTFSLTKTPGGEMVLCSLSLPADGSFYVHFSWGMEPFWSPGSRQLLSSLSPSCTHMKQNAISISRNFKLSECRDVAFWILGVTITRGADIDQKAQFFFSS